MFRKLFGPYLGLRKEIYIIFISRTINAMGAFVFPFLTLLLTEKNWVVKGRSRAIYSY